MFMFKRFQRRIKIFQRSWIATEIQRKLEKGGLAGLTQSARQLLGGTG